METKVEKVLEQLGTYSTPELCDGSAYNPAMDYGIKRQVTEKKIVGIAYPVLPDYGCSGIIPDAILQAEPGHILVIAGKGFCKASFWGDHRSLCAARKGLAGVIIDGAFRDIDGCKEAEFPVFARTVVPNSADKSRGGRLNVPVECGGQRISPGDFIIGDANGVVVIKPHEVTAVMQKADAKRKAENETIRKMEETGEILPRVIWQR